MLRPGFWRCASRSKLCAGPAVSASRSLWGRPPSWAVAQPLRPHSLSSVRGLHSGPGRTSCSGPSSLGESVLDDAADTVSVRKGLGGHGVGEATAEAAQVASGPCGVTTIVCLLTKPEKRDHATRHRGSHTQIPGEQASQDKSAAERQGWGQGCGVRVGQVTLPAGLCTRDPGHLVFEHSVDRASSGGG